MMHTVITAPKDFAADLYRNDSMGSPGSGTAYLNMVKNPIHYSKTTYNLTQLMYTDGNTTAGKVDDNSPAASAEDNNLRRQYYHHRHHVHEESLKNKPRFSATVLPSNCNVVRDSKLSFTPPSSPTVGSGMTSFPCSTNVYYSSSSSGCYSKNSYSSCSSNNSISPRARKRRADEGEVSRRRQGCRSSNSSGVGSCCSCDKCLSNDTFYQSEDHLIVQSGKRSKNDTDDDVVFISETPGYDSRSSSSSNPYSQISSQPRPKSMKSNKKTRKALKKSTAQSKVSPFAVPFSIPTVASKPKTSTSGYFLRSTTKEKLEPGTNAKLIPTAMSDQRQNTSSTTSVENSIQQLAINISNENNNPCTFNIQTRSKANKTDAVMVSEKSQQSSTSSQILPTGHVEQSNNKAEITSQQLNDQMQNSRYRDAKSSSNFRKSYEIHGVIGVGGGGTVYAGTRKSDNVQVAVKDVPKNKVKRWGKLDGRVVPIEFDLLHRATTTGHKGIIQMLDWFERRKSYILVMERPQPVIDLFDYLNQNGALTESAARNIFLQIVDSVLHCHANGVIHRDIKDENVLLNLHTQEAKLIDFGCGTVLKNAPYTEFAGTPEFYPPEWFTQKKYNGERVDAWSLGVLLFTMLEAEVPFSTEQKIVACELNFKHGEKLSESCKSLLAWMLQKDERTRPTILQALQHPWFRDSIRSSKTRKATKDQLVPKKIQPVITLPSGHMIATNDSPMSPQHNGTFQVIPHAT